MLGKNRQQIHHPVGATAVLPYANGQFWVDRKPPSNNRRNLFRQVTAPGQKAG